MCSKIKNLLKWSIPSFFLLIGILFSIWSFIIPTNFEETKYDISFWAELVDNKENHVIFQQTNFYYDFTREEGYFKFQSLQNISLLVIDFPTELVNHSIEVYNIKGCTESAYGFCNETKIFPYIKINETYPYNAYPINTPKKSSKVSIIFDNFDVNKSYLINFKLKNFKPKGRIYLHRNVHRNSQPLILRPDNNGNLMFNLGDNYECEDCFYEEKNLEKEFWSSNKILRIKIPEEGQSLNPLKNYKSSHFKIDTLPVKNLEYRNLFFTLGLSLSVSMIAVIVTLVSELNMLSKPKQKEMSKKIIKELRSIKGVGSKTAEKIERYFNKK